MSSTAETSKNSEKTESAYTHSALSDVKAFDSEGRHIVDTHTKTLNKLLVCGWLLIVFVLLISYTIEVMKGERTVLYVVKFIIVTAVPAIATLVFYIMDPDRHKLRYEVEIGYFIMYVFVMLTGNTSLVFVYILPFLSLLILYHEPKIILYTGIATLLLNGITIFIRFRAGDLTLKNSRDAEIQMALLFLCFLGCFLSSRLYDRIYKRNLEYTEKLTFQNEAMKEMTMQTIMTIANTIDAKDEYTRGHSRRVAEYSYAIAKEIGYSLEDAEDVRFIGLLHDIGKIGIPDAVLNKPGRLTDEEYEVMKSHTSIGSDILKDIAMIKDLDIGARSHHERPDGKGYPEGLKGDELPMIARIIAVADAYDAMSSNRVYRRHLEPERVLKELRSGVGTQWDEECCMAMIRLIEEDRLPEVDITEESDTVSQATKILSRVIDTAEDKASEKSEHYDSLTRSFGREHGINVIQQAISEHGRGCLFVFDIDHFRRINEAQGFATGDRYLKALTDLIRIAYKDSIISRFGADVFVVYCPTLLDMSAGEKACSPFFTILTERTNSDPSVSELSVSIGITEVMTEKDQVMVLYENATKALYVAKQLGGNNYYCHMIEDVYDDRMKNETVDLNHIVEMIKNLDHLSGGMVTGYPEFEKMYEYMSNLAERNSQNIRIVLFTMSQNENSKASSAEKDKVMDLLQKAITSSIRNVDITTRYSSSQEAVLLLNLDEDQLKNVINRIMTEFYRTYDKREFSVRYDMADLSRPE